jgi:hypothetical protein
LITAVAAIVGAASLGSVLVLTGAVDLVGEPSASRSNRIAQTQLLDCRGGIPVDSVSNGDSVYVVGIDASGEWVAIRRPSALGDVGWLPSSLLESNEDLSSLPVLPCEETGVNAMSLVEEPTTTVPATETTVPVVDTTTPVVDTTVPVTEPTVTVTVPTTDTTMPPPPDTTPPQVFEYVIDPEKIYPGADPGACDSGTYDIYGSAYATVVNEVDPVMATLTWRYMPASYEYSGSFPVSVEPSGSGFQLIGSISDLPQPYTFGLSAPKIVVELTWTVRDAAGNPFVEVVPSAFEVGRCV